MCIALKYYFRKLKVPVTPPLLFHYAPKGGVPPWLGTPALRDSTICTSSGSDSFMQLLLGKLFFGCKSRKYLANGMKISLLTNIQNVVQPVFYIRGLRHLLGDVDI